MALVLRRLSKAVLSMGMFNVCETGWSVILPGSMTGLTSNRAKKIDAGLRDHLSPVVKLGGDRFDERGTSAHVLMLKVAMRLTGLTGLVEWSGRKKALVPARCFGGIE
jgi:hypothetical protein